MNAEEVVAWLNHETGFSPLTSEMNMNNKMPCITDSEEWRFDPDGPDDESTLPKYRNHTNRAAVEDELGVDVGGLCRMWGNWRDSNKLLWILHGFLMITPIKFTSEAWQEIDFLQEILMIEDIDNAARSD